MDERVDMKRTVRRLIGSLPAAPVGVIIALFLPAMGWVWAMFLYFGDTSECAWILQEYEHARQWALFGAINGPFLALLTGQDWPAKWSRFPVLWARRLGVGVICGLAMGMFGNAAVAMLIRTSVPITTWDIVVSGASGLWTGLIIGAPVVAAIIALCEVANPITSSSRPTN